MADPSKVRPGDTATGHPSTTERDELRRYERGEPADPAQIPKRRKAPPPAKPPASQPPASRPPSRRV